MIVFAAILVFLLIPSWLARRDVEIMLDDFISNYDIVKDIIDKDMEIKDIITTLSDEENNEYADLTDLYFNFGKFGDFAFSNCNEMRRCFLIAGEGIMKYEEIVTSEYGYTIQESEIYEIFMAILKEIRIICLNKGEDSVVVL